MSICLFVTEETLEVIERGETMAHYCTHLCPQWTTLYTITACVCLTDPDLFVKGFKEIEKFL